MAKKKATIISIILGAKPMGKYAKEKGKPGKAGRCPECGCDMDHEGMEDEMEDDAEEKMPAKGKRSKMMALKEMMS